MATTLEIVNAISQVVANTYDGDLDESGEPCLLYTSPSPRDS